MINLIFGTRPDAIKVGPVVRELTEQGVVHEVICTGQHTDLLHGTPTETDLKKAKSLKLSSDDSVPRWTHRATKYLQTWFEKHKPRIVVIQGDTMTASAAAHAAYQANITVAHIEAGLRSGNINDPWPEEKIRRTISYLASIHYCPTQSALDNLQREGIDGKRLLTGNTVVDALRLYAEGDEFSPRFDSHPPVILMTLHRRELRMRSDAGVVLGRLYEAIAAQKDFVFVWPIHPAMLKIKVLTALPENLKLIGPMGYRRMISFLRGSYGVLTDSGGLVEEAVTVGTPVAIVRNYNDRPEAETAKMARLFNPTPQGVENAVTWIVKYNGPREPNPAFGNGHAAEEIVNHLRRLV